VAASDADAGDGVVRAAGDVRAACRGSYEMLVESMGEWDSAAMQRVGQENARWILRRCVCNIQNSDHLSLHFQTSLQL
jgi:hypothetical protein